ncbi:hypothetical protein GGI03_005144 [Coemansia sp. RSA 2337]|nr:hypothetical protein LPJ71_006908 [Coemansia sp. S17]KAJ2018873.1 hypothetical protein GGI14_002001 [Coemansia sp. S680]KAJ2024201.1 hypothetical protein H4S03_009164 [Coemansia sp. S3946]KAJ2067111.1 hypothetical protein GGH13_005444 [Coemansia sp. S155-1]KAJ2105251.1 hypothetical protein IW146_008306 [Coemansia sp. RSA 922]KAJ2334001.1 hypothetical protein GGH92_008449 [Coemansia sp. RSA 2673]KAJ2461014.1 hypothetical protein GGI03_005144 [Coemansia sp. RSA 2337]
MKITALLVALSATAHASVYHLSTARDATVSYSGIKNSDGSFESLTPKGTESTLTTFKGNKDYRRVLLGFHVPAKVKDPSRITKCVLHVPVPKDSPDQDYSLTAYTASSNWDEATVNGATKVTSTKELGTVNVPKDKNPGTIDVTGACQAASEGNFSMFIDTNQPLVTFYSKESGKPTFTLDMTY